MNALRRGRTLFGTPVELKTGCSLQLYFFDTSRLIDGNPPRDRCCKLCNKIGHVVKDCPMKKLESKREYDEIVEAEKDIYCARTGAHTRRGYENGGYNQSGGRGMGRTPPSAGGPKDQLSSGERLLNAFTHTESRARGNQPQYFREMRSSHLTQFEQMRANIGYGHMGGHRELPIVQHPPGLSCAPNWKPSAEAQQMQRNYSKYPNAQDPYMQPRNHQSYFGHDQERPHGQSPGHASTYNREEAQGLRSSPPRRVYDQRYATPTAYAGGHAYDHPDNKHDPPMQNSRRYK